MTGMQDITAFLPGRRHRGTCGTASSKFTTACPRAAAAGRPRHRHQGGPGG
jgi:hypothetical protein